MPNSISDSTLGHIAFDATLSDRAELKGKLGASVTTDTSKPGFFLSRMFRALFRGAAEKEAYRMGAKNYLAALKAKDPGAAKFAEQALDPRITAGNPVTLRKLREINAEYFRLEGIGVDRLVEKIDDFMLKEPRLESHRKNFLESAKAKLNQYERFAENGPSANLAMLGLNAHCQVKLRSAIAKLGDSQLGSSKSPQDETSPSIDALNQSESAIKNLREEMRNKGTSNWSIRHPSIISAEGDSILLPFEEKAISAARTFFNAFDDQTVNVLKMTVPGNGEDEPPKPEAQPRSRSELAKKLLAPDNRKRLLSLRRAIDDLNLKVSEYMRVKHGKESGAESHFDPLVEICKKALPDDLTASTVSQNIKLYRNSSKGAREAFQVSVEPREGENMLEELCSVYYLDRNSDEGILQVEKVITGLDSK